jgi:hypothetical protein
MYPTFFQNSCSYDNISVCLSMALQPFVGPWSPFQFINPIHGSPWSGLENREYGRGDPLRWTRNTLYPQNLALTSPTSGGLSVGIVRLRNKVTELFIIHSPWTVDQPVEIPLPTDRTTQTQYKRTQISKHWLGFEPTIPAFERAKIVHALDGASTVIGHSNILVYHLVFWC